MTTIAMIPARMGSQRLAKKNLRELGGIPLITRAVRKCVEANCFDEVWVNSEHPEFEAIAEREGVMFHHRPPSLASDSATSEDYVAEFLNRHTCEHLIQVHSIAPLLTVVDLRNFVKYFRQTHADCLLSCEEIQIECAYEGKPINFSFDEKTNSQDLMPIQRVSWSVTGWRRESYLKAASQGLCATYSGNVEFFPVNRLGAHVIKTESDLEIAEALLSVLEKNR